MELKATDLYSDGNLEGYWRLESDGTDETSNDNDLLDGGTPTHEAVKYGNGVDLDTATPDYLYIADASQTGLDITGDISMVTWLKGDSWNTLNSAMSKFDSGANQRAYDLGIEVSGYMYLTVSDDGGSANTHMVRYQSDNHQLSTGILYHVGVSFDISTETCLFYLNGVEDTSSVVVGSTIGATLHNSSANFALGTNYNNGSSQWRINGKMDDSALFSRILTESEFQTLAEDISNSKGRIIGL